MEKHWKYGDPCFIVHTNMTPGSVRMEVMPAAVRSVSGRGGRHSALAISLWGHHLGPLTHEGKPFETEEAARAWIKSYAEEVVAASNAINMVGKQPALTVPPNLPEIGQTVFTVLEEEREILEVVVGIISGEFGPCRVGYDSSPGNPEADNFTMDKWWETREAAELWTMETFGEKFTFVSKEEVARRIDGQIEDIWLGAMRNLRNSRDGDARVLGRILGKQE